MYTLLVFIVITILVGQSPQTHAQSTYISPKIGSGTDVDPFRPRRTVGGWDECIDLTSHFLCMGSTVPSGAGVLPLSTNASSRLNVSEKLALQAVTGKVVAADTFQDLVTDILDTKGIVLEPEKDNRQHLRLRGREVWARPAPLKAFVPGVVRKLDAALHWPLDMLSASVAWAASIAETFTATDGNLAGCEARGCTHTWTEPLAGKDWTIVSNQANVATLTGGLGRNDSALATGDHEVTATVVSFASTGGGIARCGVAARKDNAGTDTFYRFFGDTPAGGTLSYEIQRRAAGATTSLASNAQDPVANDVLKLRVQGSDLSGYVNGVLLIGPVTDGSPITSANTYTGIWANASTSTFSCTIDGFSAADYTAAVVRQRGAVMFP